MFDFARLQIAALCLAAAAVLPWLWQVAGLDTAWGWGWTALALAAAGVQAAQILPYTRVWKRQSPDARQTGPAEASVSILVANVLQTNRNYAALKQIVTREGADICLFMETDQGWADALAEIEDGWPHRADHIDDNLYGMMFWSRLPRESVEVGCRVSDDIPSIFADIALTDGPVTRFFAIHPEPPAATSSTVDRDAELVAVGEAAAALERPVIVLGDLNDVAWSRTTIRFQRLSGLLDPRIGRGLFSTFHAKHWFLRWPLDHLFHSPDFRIVSVRRLERFGSDHFPVRFDIEYSKNAESEAETPDDANAADREEAAELKEDAGTDVR